MKKCIVFVMALMLGCSGKNPLFDSAEFFSYFPLSVGNTWHYYRQGFAPSGTSSSYQITAKRKINGKTYFEYRELQSIETRQDREYFRMEGDKLYRLVAIADTADFSGVDENLPYADFSMEQGETFTYYQYTGGYPVGDCMDNTGHGIFKWTFTVTVEEKTPTRVVFFYDSPNAIDEEYSFEFTKGIGITKKDLPGGWGAQVLIGF